ncbi:MAG: filamentous hemagglutinin N-terminal domain-containing protein, partial [Cyanobacteria bacterium P01_H01_bin.15]
MRSILSVFVALNGILLLSSLQKSATVQAETASQIRPDQTISTPTEVRRAGQQLEIIRGTEAGKNLFHSFLEFSVGINDSVEFINNNPSIQNVINRVTGSSPSHILGQLKAGGTAPNFDLFLLNPNGIIFGPNSSLDINGSFLATTADSIQFGTTGEFSAINPSDPSLLTVLPSALFFNRSRTQPISISGSNEILDPRPGLAVVRGENLLFLGGDINIDAATLEAPNGRIDLGGLSSAGAIALNYDQDGLQAGFSNDIPRANVSISNASLLEVTDQGNGSININAQDIVISGLSEIYAGIAS